MKWKKGVQRSELNFTSKKCEVTLQSTNATCLSLILIFLHWLERFSRSLRDEEEIGDEWWMKITFSKSGCNLVCLLAVRSKMDSMFVFKMLRKSWCINFKVSISEKVDVLNMSVYSCILSCASQTFGYTRWNKF